MYFWHLVEPSTAEHLCSKSTQILAANKTDWISIQCFLVVWGVGKVLKIENDRLVATGVLNMCRSTQPALCEGSSATCLPDPVCMLCSIRFEPFSITSVYRAVVVMRCLGCCCFGFAWTLELIGILCFSGTWSHVSTPSWSPTESTCNKWTTR